MVGPSRYQPWAQGVCSRSHAGIARAQRGARLSARSVYAELRPVDAHEVRPTQDERTHRHSHSSCLPVSARESAYAGRSSGSRGETRYRREDAGRAAKSLPVPSQDVSTDAHPPLFKAQLAFPSAKRRFEGPAGSAGPQGPSGPAGAQGATGTAGPAGPQGTAGATGAQGNPGLAGATGATGPAGPLGPSGATGAPGNPGAAGATGATGPAGLEGPAGPTGAQGNPGAAGAAGATGPAGPQGPTGPAGAGTTFVSTVLVTSTAGGSGLVSAATTACANASSSNPYLLKIEAGTYDLGTSYLPLCAHVDVEGSGEDVTNITGHGAYTLYAAQTGVSIGEVRLLSVANTSSADTRAVFFGSGDSWRLRQVTVSVNGGFGDGDVGISSQGPGFMDHVTLNLQGFSDVGLAATGAVTVEVADSSINSPFGNLTYGILTYANLYVRNTKTTNTSVGISLGGGTSEVHGSTLGASAFSLKIGAGSVAVYNSKSPVPPAHRRSILIVPMAKIFPFQPYRYSTAAGPLEALVTQP